MTVLDLGMEGDTNCRKFLVWVEQQITPCGCSSNRFENGSYQKVVDTKAGVGDNDD